MKNIYFSALLCLSIPLTLQGQNLAPNPNFEIYSTCPNSVAQLQYATGWMHVSGHGGSADYMNVCSASGLVDVPGNAFGTQTPGSGNGYVGFAMYYQSTPDFREYIQTQFTSPLVAGQTYTIQFSASLSDNSTFSAPCFQFYFSNAALTWGLGGWGPITTVTPQVSSTVHITSKTTWQTLTATYTAVGGEQFMTMGNFRNDATTPGITPAGAGAYTTVYYYIDNYSVTPGAPLPVDLLYFNGECSDHGTTLRWTTASEINNDYFTIESSTDGVNYTTEFTVDGGGNSNEEKTYSYTTQLRGIPGMYFRLSQTDYDGNVHEFSPKYISCEESLLDDCPVVFANEDQVDIEIYSSSGEELNMTLLDSKGSTLQTLHTNTAEGLNTVNMNTEGLSAGIYIVVISGANRQCSAKFLKN